MAKYTGNAKIYSEGQEIATDKGATLQVGGVKREPKVGAQVYGYNEEVIPPEVSCKVFHGPDTDIKKINALADATIIFECDNGPRYVLRSAFVTETGELDSKDGSLQVKFSALSCDRS